MTKLLFLFITLFTFKAFSMPCDSGYLCNSASGKFQIELKRCRYKNELSLLSFKIDNADIKDAMLGPYWDGKSTGDTVLAFQINLPPTNDIYSLVSIEITRNPTRGQLKVKTITEEPGPMKVVFSEFVSCVAQ